ncbi:hypothetical protein [uncultured Tenacibaculum sp.]|uniref:hypothetical protein n=1 Tax=uncultured Tenacibaculum sp. TaxID=174713 RepID=UPI0026385F22|nr:hypothetical protein [uncultured Tenacibaculum sp.]
MKLTLEQQQKGQDLYNELVQKAWENATFKEELIKNPEATISEVLGQEFKGNVVVEDQTNENTIYLNIPRKIDLGNFELTDEQLEVVSGGEAKHEHTPNLVYEVIYHAVVGLTYHIASQLK